MLRLDNITKNYIVADNDIKVLKGINLSFRKNEFVAILGPSGCGKTTTLNIIGGLDKYTTGDLFIAGKSTKEFNDHDWDIYRNQRIGFIFQSYNLIPHQTVLGNVELALTISGVSKEERIKKAKEALDNVGLKNEYFKRPNQLSGGQCQRVAIARALVNEPEILLADEPTGALDTETSIQIMELIKEIAKDRLVIMVTHNPDLAQKYATRIINLLDGKVVHDSNPFSEKAEIMETDSLSKEKINKKSKAKMSWWTAFKLSFRNLLSKKRRTLLTCFAGSIGIIGISAVLAVSNGVKGFVSNMQEDMLSGNPITITEKALDFSFLMSSMSTSDKMEFIKEEGYVNVDSLMAFLMERYNLMEKGTIMNEITKEYIQFLYNMPDEYVANIKLNYGLDITNNVYTDFKGSDNFNDNISLTAIRNTYTNILKETNFKDYASVIASMDNILSEAPNNDEYILSQYNLKSGRIAKEKNEIMIVLDSDSMLTDIVLAYLGYYSQDEFLNIVYKASEDENYLESLDKYRFSYSELLGKTFTWFNNDSVFNIVENNPLTPFSYNYRSEGLSGGLELKVVGILEPKEGISYGSLSSGFYYTEALTKYIFEQNLNSDIVNYLKSAEKDSFTSTIYSNIPTGITYHFTYNYLGEEKEGIGFVGKVNSMASMMGSISGGNPNDIYVLSLRELGGNNLANSIAIYPTNFEQKDNVIKYLDMWNSDNDITIEDITLTKEERSKIQYTDTLTIIISIINSMINIVTIALIAFTALSLVVSCVMIAIITYVSVVERIKEIGVIRSLGGRKKDVSNLFNAETLIIGLMSGLFGVFLTYGLSFVVNLIVDHFSGINKIADLKISNAITMVILSVVLTVISGLIPAKKASKQDPVVALRTE